MGGRQVAIKRSMALWGLVLSFSPVTARDVVSLFEQALMDADPPVFRTYKTVDQTDLQLYLFPPDSGADPRNTAIIWYHGGGWEGGIPQFIMPHARYFARLGYFCIVPEYRLAGDGDNTIFDCVDDARDAFYWALEHAEDLGFDPARMVVGGESAGGHLAACVGYIPDGRSPDIPNPQPWPTATILVNPIVNLLPLNWALSKPGLTPADTELAQSISPLFFVGPDSPPTLLLHGDADDVVPAQQSIDFANALYAESVAANLRIWPDKGHAFFLYLPQFNLTDKLVIHLSLLEAEAFLQAERLNGYPVVHGHFSPLHLFAESDGWQGSTNLRYAGGRLYGTTASGGPDGTGTSFSLDPDTRKYLLLGDPGSIPPADPVPAGSPIAIDDSGYLYGIQPQEDPTDGYLYRINSDETGLANLHEFAAGLAGHVPVEHLVFVDGSFYGITTFGGLTTDTIDPQTGGGMIFRYTPIAAPSPARAAYVDWLAEGGLLVNQPVTGDSDRDGWELIEEFSYGGNPMLADGESELEILLPQTGLLQLGIPRLRSIMAPHIKLQSSSSLQEWGSATGYTEETTTLESGFERRSYQWDAGALSQGQIFLRLVTGLND